MNCRFRRLLIPTLLLILLSEVSADESQTQLGVGVGGSSDMIFNCRRVCVHTGASIIHRTSHSFVFGILADLSYSNSHYPGLITLLGYDHRRYGAIRLGVDVIFLLLWNRIQNVPKPKYVGRHNRKVPFWSTVAYLYQDKTEDIS